MQTYTFRPEEKDNGLRLDIYLVNVLPGNISRSFIQKLIRQNEVLVNGKAAKPHHKVTALEQIIVNIPEESPLSLKAENIPLEIIYEDDDLMVINKPSGLVTHPAVGNYSGTLVNALLYYGNRLSNINLPLRPGIVHRLDKDTSGLMIVAKNNQTHVFLAKQFSRHQIKRRYLALVKGIVQFDEGVIDLPLGRSIRDRQKIAVTFHKSRQAKTVYRVLKRLKSVTLLELLPQTGRTHQLRVHLAYLGHPIIGDKKYGGKNSIERLLLHSQTISFIHPRTEKFMEFTSEMPKEFEKFLKE